MISDFLTFSSTREKKTSYEKKRKKASHEKKKKKSFIRKKKKKKLHTKIPFTPTISWSVGDPSDGILISNIHFKLGFLEVSYPYLKEGKLLRILHTFLNLSDTS